MLPIFDSKGCWESDMKFDFWYAAILILRKGVVEIATNTLYRRLIAVDMRGVNHREIHKVEGANIVNTSRMVLMLVRE